MSCLALFLLVLVELCSSRVDAAPTYEIKAGYNSSEECGSSPYAVTAIVNGGCSEDAGICLNSSDGGFYSTNCSANYLQTMRDFFGTSQYIIQEMYSDASCSTLEYAIGFLVTTNCSGGVVTNQFYYKSALNGSAVIEYFALTEYVGVQEGDATCAPGNTTLASADKEQVEAHTCLPISSSGGTSDIFNYGLSESRNTIKAYKWFSSNDHEDEGGLGTATIVGVVCGVVAVILLIAVAIVCYRRRVKKGPKQQWTTTGEPGDVDSLEAANVPRDNNRGLWNDEIIIAKRIPRDKIQIKKLISRGAFGEVYAGQLHRNQVAVKMLIPATRNSLQHVNNFLAEAKMTAIMDHPHVVSFVGVAWDSLSDVCVVLEFMDGGDLRTLLNKYETSKHPVGFNKLKATIALHVCHALTYLHSLAPPVIHRDLKSRNILLNKAMEAKLTDFGISRERLDQTMTAGMGTSLWMAPEVMLGERYDIKADMFSFGVVLSELDVHTLPYAQEKKRSLDSGGRVLADATLLQRVAAGTVRVEFSEANLSSITELGCACVSVDPSQRPSAAEALYRLQVVLAQGLQ